MRATTGSCPGDDVRPAVAGQVGRRDVRPAQERQLVGVELRQHVGRVAAVERADQRLDYPARRAVISFEDSAEDAEAYASVAKTNGDTAIAKGSVAITLPVTPKLVGQVPAAETGALLVAIAEQVVIGVAFGFITALFFLVLIAQWLGRRYGVKDY